MENGLVSIVMVNYNHDDFLTEAIESVIKQTYTNWELIIVDDGSTDKSRNIIEKYRCDKRIKPFFLEKNMHICVATNIGMSKIKGEYVARLDSDDLCKNDRLEKQILYLENNKDKDVCFTQVKIIDEAGKEVKEERIKQLYKLYGNRQQNKNQWLKFFFFFGNSLLQGSALMRTEVIKKVGMFNLAYVQAHDFDFWVRAAKSGFEFGFVEEPLLYYRRINNQNSDITPENDRRFFNEHMSIRLHFFDDFPDDLFVETFQDCFVNKEAKSHEELLCEQAFLLMQCIGGNNFNPVLGLMKLEELLNCPETRAVLEEKYQFTSKVFYEENKKKQYYSPDLYREERALRKELEKMKEINKNQKDHIELLLSIKDQQQRAIEEMQNSFSWKVTKPIRGLRSKRGRVDK